MDKVVTREKMLAFGIVSPQKDGCKIKFSNLGRIIF